MSSMTIYLNTVLVDQFIITISGDVMLYTVVYFQGLINRSFINKNTIMVAGY